MRPFEQFNSKNRQIAVLYCNRSEGICHIAYRWEAYDLHRI